MSIYLIGDSHAFGLRSALSAALGQSLLFDAQNGTKTSDWISRGEHPADLTIVVLGTNDIYAGVVPEVSGRNADLVEQAQGAGSVLWVGPLNYAKDKGTAEAISRYVTKFADSRILDLPLQADGVHPTPAGYAQWAQWIAGQVVNQAAVPAQVDTTAQAPALGIFDSSAANGSSFPITAAVALGALLVIALLKS
jgi:hypothetical protein